MKALKTNEYELSNEQLIKLQTTLKSQNEEHIKLHVVPKTSNPAWTHYFRRDDTYIHSIFGNEYGPKIFKIIYSKYIILFSFLCVIGSALLLEANHRILSVILNTFSVIWCILILLSANKFAFKLVRTSFEFILKTFYAIQLFISHILLDFYRDHSIGDTLAWSWNLSFILLYVIMFCMIDSLQFTIGIKTIFCVIFGLFFAVLCFSWYFSEESQGSDYDYKIGIPSIHLSISILSIAMNSSQILAIFFWKQIVLSFIRRKRCVTIRYSPYYQWIDVDPVKKSVTPCIQENRIDDSVL